ncbi:MAG: hypothetical protein Q4Q07_05860 [Tissierellia bacterium]|nr:hypothetical protein [Tissierellia bacterium]
MRDCIDCKIPAKPEYIGIPRLMITGLAAPLDLDFDALEDLKLIITESCNLSYRMGNEEILVDAIVEENMLTVSVSGVDEDKVRNDDMLSLSSHIICSLSDQVNFEDGKIVVKKAY